MATLQLAIKVDVDTERGTREGVPPLARAFERAGKPVIPIGAIHCRPIRGEKPPVKS